MTPPQPLESFNRRSMRPPLAALDGDEVCDMTLKDPAADTIRPAAAARPDNRTVADRRGCFCRR